MEQMAGLSLEQQADASSLQQVRYFACTLLLTGLPLTSAAAGHRVLRLPRRCALRPVHTLRRVQTSVTCSELRGCSTVS